MHLLPQPNQPAALIVKRRINDRRNQRINRIEETVKSRNLLLSVIGRVRNGVLVVGVVVVVGEEGARLVFDGVSGGVVGGRAGLFHGVFVVGQEVLRGAFAAVQGSARHVGHCHDARG